VPGVRGGATRGRRARALGGVLAAVLVLTGCADTPRDVHVLAAASLGPVAEDLVAAGPVPASVTAGGSQILATQVRAGAPADVLLLADPAIADGLVADGLAGAPEPVAATGLAVVTRPDAGVESIADLADPGLRVVLADQGVPLGAYTRTGLERLEAAGLVPAGTAAAVLAGTDSLEDDASRVLAKVASGEADAAVVYATDAARAEGLTVLEWPTEADVTAVYTVQVVGDDARAVELAAWLASPEARAVWRSHGFLPPP
jgi:molybdate transport system substrate-binding protein